MKGSNMRLYSSTKNSSKFVSCISFMITYYITIEIHNKRCDIDGFF